jgi:hypothetical protein
MSVLGSLQVCTAMRVDLMGLVLVWLFVPAIAG